MPSHSYHEEREKKPKKKRDAFSVATTKQSNEQDMQYNFPNYLFFFYCICAFLIAEEPSKPKSYRCGHCMGCYRVEDCGRCTMCRDMRKYGGPGRHKGKCLARVCTSVVSSLSLAVL